MRCIRAPSGLPYVLDVTAVPDTLEEYCPSCGRWVNYLAFDHDEGWCNECATPHDSAPKCTSCGTTLNERHARTMCHACRLEEWFTQHADELEWLMVVKGYSVWKARLTITNMVRPLCQHCSKPIKGGNSRALFHNTGACKTAYARYKRLQRQGLTSAQALDTLKSQSHQGR